MYQRMIALLLTVLCLLCLCSCGGSKLESFASEDSLLTVDGNVIMTVKDFRRLLTQQAVSHDILDTEKLKEKELFIQQAEIALLAYVAAEAGLSVERTQLEEEFDDHMLEIQDTDVYGDQLLFSTTLQAALAMDDDAYKQWSVEESMKDYRLNALLQDIASVYMHITDEEILREFMQQNLLEITRFYEIEIFYPDVNTTDFDFSDLL